MGWPSLEAGGAATGAAAAAGVSVVVGMGEVDQGARPSVSGLASASFGARRSPWYVPHAFDEFLLIPIRHDTSILGLLESFRLIRLLFQCCQSTLPLLAEVEFLLETL